MLQWKVRLIVAALGLIAAVGGGLGHFNWNSYGW